MVPVEKLARYTFVRDGGGNLSLRSVRDRAWEKKSDRDPDPWELGPVDIESTDHVLGVFDSESVDAAQQIMASVV